MNDAIREMKKVPGVYIVTHPTMKALGLCHKVEVLEDGTVYELDYNDKRDSLLNDEGWNDEVIVEEKLK